MPDRLRRLRRTEWADANRAGAAVDCFLEGPCFDAAGRLHVVDIPYGRIFRIEGDAWAVIAEYDGWPNGLKVLPDGTLLAADYRRGLIRIDPTSGDHHASSANSMSESFKGLNDLTLHRDGSILFTDQGQTGLQDPTGRVWRLHPDGRLDRLLTTGPSPNGIVLNTAQTHLYVAMTRSCEVWRFLLRHGRRGGQGAVLRPRSRRHLRPGRAGDGRCRPAVHLQPGPRLRLGGRRARRAAAIRIDSCAGRHVTNCALGAGRPHPGDHRIRNRQHPVLRGAPAMTRAFVSICEVGPRDGLQIAKTRMATDAKVRWIAAMAAAGVKEIEVGSFVPPRVIPQTGRHARRSCARCLDIPGLTVIALVPNLRGAQNAYARRRAQDQHPGLGQRRAQPRQPQPHAGGDDRG